MALLLLHNSPPFFHGGVSLFFPSSALAFALEPGVLFLFSSYFFMACFVTFGISSVSYFTIAHLHTHKGSPGSRGMYIQELAAEYKRKTDGFLPFVYSRDAFCLLLFFYYHFLLSSHG